MQRDRRSFRSRAAAAALIGVLALAGAAAAEPSGPPPAAVVAQAEEPPPANRELQPRYEPAPVPKKSWYNDSYLFGLTRGVADSTLVPGAKVPLFLLTVPTDLVLLPFAAIGGLFG